MHVAAKEGSLANVEFLLKEARRKSVSLDLEDRRGNTALFQAFKAGHDAICLLLHKAGAKLKAPKDALTILVFR